MTHRQKFMREFLYHDGYPSAEKLHCMLDMFGKPSIEPEVGQMWLLHSIREKEDVATPLTTAVFVISHVLGDTLRGWLVVPGRDNLVLATKFDQKIEFENSPILDCFVCGAWASASLLRDHLHTYYGKIEDDYLDLLFEKSFSFLRETLLPTFDSQEMKELHLHFAKIIQVFSSEAIGSMTSIAG